MKIYTRRIDREYQRILYTNSEQIEKNDGDIGFKLDPHQLGLASDYLIGEMFDMTQKEVEELSKKEYTEKLQEANEAKDF